MSKPQSRGITSKPSLTEIFGTPPVLSTENIEAFNTMVSSFLDIVKPRDLIEQMLIRDLTEASWDIRRYSRHKTLSIERKFRDRITYEAKIKKEHEERRKQVLANLATEESPKLERSLELQLDMDELVPDADKILLREPDEFDHARALEDGIEFHEKLDKLLNAAVVRRDDALEQLNRYRTGLGSELRRRSEEIINAEFSEAENAAEERSIVPSIEGPAE